VKPKRPTETDLLAIVKNGFDTQLPKDREALAPAPAPAPAPAAKPEVEASPTTAGPGSIVPMVRITLAIPEDMRYRLKMSMMNHRRKHRDRMTQDEFCAQAIAAHLDQEERGANAAGHGGPLAAFLKDCLHDRGLTKGWAPKARALLESLGHEVSGASSS